MASDIQRALAHHISGDEYIVEYQGVWDDHHDQPLGTRIIAAVGPISRRELGIDGPLHPSAELFDRIDAALNLSDEDADWLQAEEAAGRLTYPIGAR